jgi:hypothetical protein
MSSTGIGLTVFTGFMIGIPIARPEVPLDTLLIGSALWGLITGFVFALWKMALAGLQPPSFGSRR